MKKAAIILLISCVLCWADVIYYNSDYKITNCKVIEQKGNEYVVQTFTQHGKSSMNILKSIVDAIEESPVDSTQLSHVIQKNKGDEINITEINKKQREEYEKQQDTIKKKINNKIQEDKNKDELFKKNYYYKTNIPLLATGMALTTHGLISLFSTGKLNKMINEYESEDLLPDSFIDDLKNDLAKAYIYGAIFTIAGAIDIYYSFEKVEIELEATNLNLSYNF